MDMTNLRAANVARDQEWNTGSERVSMTFRATELAGEVGEACNVIKKLERERIGLVGSRDTKEHLAEELADIVICTDLVAMYADIDLDAAIAAKFNATSEKNGLSTRLSKPVPVTTLPFEATPEMVKAALDLVWEDSETHDDLVCRLWRTMAAVAQVQPSAARELALKEEFATIRAMIYCYEGDSAQAFEAQKALANIENAIRALGTSREQLNKAVPNVQDQQENEPGAHGEREGADANFEKVIEQAKRAKALEAKLAAAEKTLERAAFGFDQIHQSLMSNGPKQASGEVTAFFLAETRAALGGKPS